MAEGLTRSSLRTPARQIGTEAGRLMREARRLERAGFSGAAQQVALASAQQKLSQRGGFSSADSRIEEAKLKQQADKQEAAVRSGFAPADDRRKLFNDMRSASRGGLTGEEGTKKLAGFQARATQLGVAPDRFAATATGKLGIDLRALAGAAQPVLPTSTATTTAVVDPAATTTTVVDPAATTTTVVDPAATTTSVVDVLKGVRSGGRDPEAFGTRVRLLTSGGITRGEAVRAANSELMAVGKAPFNYRDTINAMREQDKSAAADADARDTVERAEREIDQFLTGVRNLTQAQVGSVDPTTGKRVGGALTPQQQAAAQKRSAAAKVNRALKKSAQRRRQERKAAKQ